MKNQVVSHDEWLAARTKLLAREKEFTKMRDEMSKAVQSLPWEKVEKSYTFEGPRGKESLADLFEGRSQLVVYHFMFTPDWDAGCAHCSFWADNFNPAIVHMNQRDVTMVAISRAPYAKLAAYEKRMGWSFKWLSSHDSDFNFDFYASFEDQKNGFYNYRKGDTDWVDREGVSVFYKDESGAIFHTYSTFARGIDLLNTAYNYLDLVPKGRDEGGRSQYWVKRHDEYGR